MCIDSENEGCGLNRRDFLLRGAAATAGLVVLGVEGAAQNKEQPPTRVLDDPTIESGKVMFTHGGKETFDGFLARPKADGTFPGVLVIAGNVITEEYIPNTCAALALAGFVGLAPNVFHTLPESAKTDEDRRKAFKEHTQYDTLEDIQVGADYLKTQPFVKADRMGIIGFCGGGQSAMLFAGRSREIDAVVAFSPRPHDGRPGDRRPPASPAPVAPGHCRPVDGRDDGEEASGDTEGAENPGRTLPVRGGGSRLLGLHA